MAIGKSPLARFGCDEHSHSCQDRSGGVPHCERAVARSRWPSAALALPALLRASDDGLCCLPSLLVRAAWEMAKAHYEKLSAT